MKKLSTFLLCICLALGTIGCASAPSELSPEQPPTATVLPEISPSPAPNKSPVNGLSIASSNKGYNPYLTSDTLVKQNANLLFENLIEISPSFVVEYRLAKSVSIQGTIVTISLRDNCFFADGTAITLQDAAASLRAAKECERYATRFTNVIEITTSETELIITLVAPDSLFVYLLDVPILKESDLTSTTPTASGRYTYGTDETFLLQNRFAPFATDGPARIALVPTSNYDTMMSALAIGDINYAVQGEAAYDESSSIAWSEHYYKTNTLLFLGVNAAAHNPLCNTAEGRMLLSALIDRDALAVETYDARAYAARGALNPFYPIAKDTQSILSVADDHTLAPTMETLGYTYDKDTLFYRNNQGETAHVSILLSPGNAYKVNLVNAMTTQWAKYGIETTVITASDFNSFLTLLQSNQFELYIGELKLYNNIELSCFWNGSASYGIRAHETLLNSYAAFRADANAATALAFEESFATQMPYIPLLWRNGIVLTSRGSGGACASISNQFYALETLHASS